MTIAGVQRSGTASPGKVDVEDGLRRSRLFRVLEPAVLSALAARCEQRRIPRGEAIWERGDPCESLAVVLTGSVRCGVAHDEHRAWVRRMVGPGGTAGLPSALGTPVQACSLHAAESARLILIPVSEIRSLVEWNHAFARTLAHELSAELRDLVEACEQLSLHSPLERLARYIMAVAGDRGTGDLGGTQSQVAAQIGTVREVVGRGLRKLESDGVVSRKGRRVRVLDHEALARAAGNSADATPPSLPA